jgi:hypothetical protein
MQTAELNAPGSYELKLQADIIFNRNGGFNFSPHFGTGLIEHILDVEAWIGTGTTDFQIGGLAKYNFLPDIDGQIGLSFLGGTAFIVDSTGAGTITSLLLTTGFVASKSFNANFGKLVPYLAFEVEGLINGTNSQVPITLMLGSRWDPTITTPWRFFSEFSFGLKDSYYGLALGASYPF